MTTPPAHDDSALLFHRDNGDQRRFTAIPPTLHFGQSSTCVEFHSEGIGLEELRAPAWIVAIRADFLFIGLRSFNALNSSSKRSLMPARGVLLFTGPILHNRRTRSQVDRWQAAVESFELHSIGPIRGRRLTCERRISDCGKTRCERCRSCGTPAPAMRAAEQDFDRSSTRCSRHPSESRHRNIDGGFALLSLCGQHSAWLLTTNPLRLSPGADRRVGKSHFCRWMHRQEFEGDDPDDGTWLPSNFDHPLDWTLAICVNPENNRRGLSDHFEYRE